MPTTTPMPTKNPGDVLTSTLWNSYLRDNIDKLLTRGHRVLTVAQFGALTGPEGTKGTVAPDEAYVEVDSTNGIVWHSHYESTDGSSSKWRFIGGPPMSAFVATGQSLGSTTYVDLATVGPAIVLPRLGDYIFGYSCQVTAVSLGNVTEWILMAYALSGGTTYAAVDADAAATMVQVANQGLLPVTASMPARPHASIAAGTTVTAKYRNNFASTATSTVANRRITAYPARIG